MVLDTDTRHGCCLAEVCRFACGSYLPLLWMEQPTSVSVEPLEGAQQCSRSAACSAAPAFENSQPGAKSEGRYSSSGARVNYAGFRIKQCRCKPTLILARALITSVSHANPLASSLSSSSSQKISGCNARGKKTPISEWLFCMKPLFPSLAQVSLLFHPV